ncbi:translation initiation factor eIF-1A [Haladaptatus sp. DYSN1]|uniref:translation initiation factor eIF-1A n=2 Tax=unclassified Haladaptatus TaxID=2622732 RepID=UPI0024074851|nr:translation initiation factor eIF-1A [Haladaptatus sp. DYSN1]
MSEEDGGRRNLRMPNSDEMFAVVTEMLGGNHVRLQCQDGEERLGRIPGRMKYRTWINEDDVVLIEPWSWQDEKANIEWRYTKQDAAQLRREGHIQ